VTPFGKIARLAIDEHRALHHPKELAALLAIMHDQQIGSVLETGTWEGGSAWAWLQVPSVQRVVSVDLHPLHPAQWLRDEMRTWLTLIEGDSTDPDTAARANEALGGAADMLMIDGGHDYKTARSDWDTYAPLVRPGGMIVLHDISGAYPPDPDFGVPQLWDEVRAGRDQLELVSVHGSMFGIGIIWPG
jgi:cephalosporin hydroxylase